MSVFIIKATVLNPSLQQIPFIYTEVVEASGYKQAFNKSGIGDDAAEITITLVDNAQDIQEFIAP